MTDADKQLICGYMGWNQSWIVDEFTDWYRIESLTWVKINFDLNDAGLCVQEMQKRGEWERFCANVFILFIDEEKSSYLFPKYIAWLFNADNFFNVFVEWRKGK